MKCFFDIALYLYRDFNVYDHYGVDKYMGSFGLCVDKKYRGRAIGEHLLAARLVIHLRISLSYPNS